VVFVHLSACVDKTYLHILILKDESRLASFFNWNFYSITYTCMPSACVCHNCLLLNDTILSSALGLKHQSVALLQTNKPRTKNQEPQKLFHFFFLFLFVIFSIQPRFIPPLWFISKRGFMIFWAINVYKFCFGSFEYFSFYIKPE